MNPALPSTDREAKHDFLNFRRIALRTFVRYAHDDADSARRMDSFAIGSLHLFERNDLGSDRINQIRAVMDAMFHYCSVIPVFGDTASPQFETPRINAWFGVNTYIFGRCLARVTVATWANRFGQRLRPWPQDTLLEPLRC